MGLQECECRHRWTRSLLPRSNERILERQPGGVALLNSSRLEANGQLLPIELLVEKEDEEVDVHLSSIK